MHQKSPRHLESQVVSISVCSRAVAPYSLNRIVHDEYTFFFPFCLKHCCQRAWTEPQGEKHRQKKRKRGRGKSVWNLCPSKTPGLPLLSSPIGCMKRPRVAKSTPLLCLALHTQTSTYSLDQGSEVYVHTHTQTHKIAPLKQSWGKYKYKLRGGRTQTEPWEHLCGLLQLWQDVMKCFLLLLSVVRGGEIVWSPPGPEVLIMQAAGDSMWQVVTKSRL